MNLPTISQLAPPSVTALIAFLAYGSQYFFRYTEPQSLEWSQAFIFNALVACIWTCYLRACCTDPGRVPPGWIPGDLKVDGVSPQQNEHNENRQRWCKRCEALKPPRAHHCKTCQRYILYEHLLLPILSFITRLLQMHSKNGSPLPLDGQLRLKSYFSSFHPLSLLRRDFYGLLGVLNVPPSVHCMD